MDSVAYCTVPPIGWSCSRSPGHTGPCAATKEEFQSSLDLVHYPPRVYVGASLHNAAKAKKVINRLIEAGVEITYDWTCHTPGTVIGAEELARIGVLEADGVRDCDLFFMVQPGRNGTHVELGIAIALHKPVIILHEADVEMEPKTFYYLQNIITHTSEDEAFNNVMAILRNR